MATMRPTSSEKGQSIYKSIMFSIQLKMKNNGSIKHHQSSTSNCRSFPSDLWEKLLFDLRMKNSIID